MKLKNFQFKFLIIICLILETIALIQIGTNLPNGYEISIYSSLSLFFYFVLAFNIICGSIFIVLSLTRPNTNVWIWGYFLLILNVLIIFCLPFIRGYEMYGIADPISHLGHIRDIINYNHIIDDELFYPILHILIAIVNCFGNIDYKIVYNYLAPLFSVFFMISMYLLSKEIFQEKEKVILTSAISLVPFIHSSYYVNFVPNGFSFMLVPLILYLYFKVEGKKSWPYSVLLVMLLFLIPFSHPLTTVVLIVFFVTIELSYLALKYVNKDFEYSISFNKPLILVVTFFTWISSFYMFSKSVNKVLFWMRGELYAATDKIATSFDKLNLSLSGKILLFMKMYSFNLIMLFLSIITFFIVLKKLKTQKFSNEYAKLFAFSMCTFVSGILVLVFMFTGDPNFEPLRSVNFTFLMTAPLAGFAIHEYIIKGFKSSKINYNIGKIFTLFLLIFLFISSILVVYQSPYIYTPNQELSKSHLTGMKWFYDNKDSSIYGITLQSASPGRFAEYFYGTNASKNDKKLNRFSWRPVADHFTYDENSTLGQSYDRDKYLLITSLEKLAYLKIWYQVGRYLSEDYVKLDNDITVNKIYADGDIEIRLVNGLKTNASA